MRNKSSVRKRLFKALRIASYVWSSITLPAWFLNSISELKLSIQVWRAMLEALAPALQFAIVSIAAIIAPVLEAWRSLLAPMRDWLAIHVPFQIPPQLIEFAVATLPLAPAIARALMLRAREARERREHLQMRDEVWKRVSTPQFNADGTQRATDSHISFVAEMSPHGGKLVEAKARTKFALRALLIIAVLVAIVLTLDVIDFLSR